MKKRILVGLLCLCIGISLGCGKSSDVSTKDAARESVLDSLQEEVEQAKKETDISIETDTKEKEYSETASMEETVSDDVKEEVTVIKESETPSLAAWVAYWDMDTAKDELNAVTGDMDTICHFAAYFDSNHVPFIPEATTEYHLWQVENEATKNMETYLTFVNDIDLEEGSSLKDTQLLYELFHSPESMKTHAAQILSMTVQGGYDGIEIDYEAIRKDIVLWNLFIDFIEELMVQADALGIKVRVLLEPNVPIDKLTFPEGPEYVMMCYNLHGHGTEPGAKADQDFLRQMVGIMEQLPGTINFALATGGFDFAEDGSVAQVTLSQAQELQKMVSAEAFRDEQSCALYFDYVDESGRGHQVWYADEETLGAWMNVIREEGHERFTIWRLGGNITIGQ